MKYERNNKTPYWMYSVGYWFLFTVLVLLLILVVWFLVNLISTRSIIEAADISKYELNWIAWVFILFFVMFFVGNIVENLVTDEIDSIEIDETNHEIRFEFNTVFSHKSPPLICSIDDPLFKYNQHSNNAVKVVLLCLVSRGRLSYNNPIGFHIRFVFLEKPRSQHYHEIFLRANCGWTKEQLEDILAELGKF